MVAGQTVMGQHWTRDLPVYSDEHIEKLIVHYARLAGRSTSDDRRARYLRHVARLQRERARRREVAK